MQLKSVFLSFFLVAPSAFAEHCWVARNCDKALETEMLKKYPSRLLRVDDALRVKLDDGATVELLSSEENDISYIVVAYFPEVSLVAIESLEYSGEIRNVYLYPMKDASWFGNHKVNVGGFPVLSPNKKRMAVFGFDIHAQYSFNGLSIYNLEDARPFLQVGVVSGVWGVSNVTWVTDTELTILKGSYNEKKDEYVNTPGTVILSNDSISFNRSN